MPDNSSGIEIICIGHSSTKPIIIITVVIKEINRKLGNGSACNLRGCMQNNYNPKKKP